MRLRSSVSRLEDAVAVTGRVEDEALSGRDIGALLVARGVLTEEEVAEVLREQRVKGRSFTDTCVAMGLCDADAVQEALAYQRTMPILPPQDDRVSRDVVAAFGDDPELTEALRSLWASLLGRRAKEGEVQATLVLAAADPQAPVSMIAANFATVIAQLGYRVLLVDGNVDAPIQHELFKVPNLLGLTSLLNGEQDGASLIRPTALANLALLPAGPPVANPAEMFERTPLCQRLRSIAGMQDVILIDAGAGSADIVASLASGSDGAVTVVKRHSTTVRELRRLVERFGDRGVETLGNILV